MSRNRNRAAITDRAKALLLYAAARERYSPDALRIAIAGVEQEPVRAYRCLKAIITSIPKERR